MSKVKINFQKIKKISQKIVWFLGEKAFVSFIIFVSLMLLIGGAIFYYYGFLVVTKEPITVVKMIELDEKLYQNFLSNYAQRKQKFFEADFKTYANPFYQE
ncbi:MAG: hypothetical protein U9Q96_00280 [Patescibacteria group bacterium]|nr:hypothetical protein [Patescibacteria group bacterium]